jgi:hypothetical protein
MSDSWLQYIPKSPTFRPSEAADGKARTLISAFLPGADSVESTFHGKVTFFHPGGNWSGVQCPACGTDAEPWWGEAMEAAADSSFSSLECVAPCCDAQVSLNEMNYGWPTGFASYVVEAMNPNSKGLSSSQLVELEAELGCELREIALHI